MRSSGEGVAPAGSPAASSDALPRNECFVFIKPHALTDAVVKVTLEAFTKANISVLATGVVSASDAENKIARHYGQLGSRAMIVDPRQDQEPSAAAQAKFAEAFGVTWAASMAAGTTVNVAGAMAVLPAGTTAAELERLWRTKKAVKLASGWYVAEVRFGAGGERRVFCINGFFPSMAAKFTDPVLAPRGFSWFHVAWDHPVALDGGRPSGLTWAAFRDEFIGPTDPAACGPRSLRGLLHARWHDLGLAKAGFGADNGFHASASPLEAMFERQLWLGDDRPMGKASEAVSGGVDDPLVVAAAAQVGAPRELVGHWATNPMVEVAHGGAATKVMGLFDAVEHMDTAACIERCQALCPAGPAVAPPGDVV